MEHQTGPDQTRPDGTGPDGTGVADAAQAAAVGVPQSGPGARSGPQGPGADGDAHVPGDGRDDSAVAGTLRADRYPRPASRESTPPSSCSTGCLAWA